MHWIGYPLVFTLGFIFGQWFVRTTMKMALASFVREHPETASAFRHFIKFMEQQ